MNITEVRVKLASGRRDRLKAFCTITLDNDFVIRDLKIIEGESGHFVAMPSRKLSDRCRKCGCKNHLKAGFCNECGSKLTHGRPESAPDGRTHMHADIAHPVNQACREYLHSVVLSAFQEEQEKAKLPGYRPADLGYAPEDD